MCLGSGFEHQGVLTRRPVSQAQGRMCKDIIPEMPKGQGTTITGCHQGIMLRGGSRVLMQAAVT